jgi:hypothetical protein
MAAVEELVSTNTGECTRCAGEPTPDGGACSPPELLRVIEEIIGAGDDRSTLSGAKLKGKPPESDILPTGDGRGAQTIRAAAAKLDCKSESCVLGRLEKLIVARGKKDEKLLRDSLAKHFKGAGPRETLELTSNFDLDGTLSRWALEFPTFFPYPYAMMDFASERSALARWSVADVLAGEKTGGRPMETAGCILNTDVSSGRGKHWVCVFVDARNGRGKSESNPVSVEYFNSAGNPPPREVTRWMEGTRDALVQARNCHITTCVVTSVKHQRSDTECGLYALFYIRARLEGRPVSAFEGKRIPDGDMTAFRRHVFRRHAVR